MENEARINKTLSNLYALRVALSVISQSADEMRDAEEKIEANIFNVIYDHKWCEFDFDIVENKEKKELKKLEKLKKDLGFIAAEEFLYSDEGYYELDEKEREEFFEKRLLIQEIVFCEWLKTDEAEEYIIAKKNKAENDFNKYQKRLESCKIELEKNKQQEAYYKQQEKKYKILTILTIPTIVGAIICKIKANKHNTKYYVVHSQLNDSNKELKNLEGNLRDIRIELKKYDLNLKNIKDSREIIRQNDEENKPIISRVKQNSDAIYSSLQKSFNKVLDERDWQYLDFIIYYLETGRAESIKEALQLLEREIQTQRIIGAMQKATECICSTIERVASRISAQLGVISNQLSLLADIQQIQMEQNIELISQLKLQNALLEKSNVSSEKLMQDVEHIKKYGIEAKIKK